MELKKPFLVTKKKLYRFLKGNKFTYGSEVTLKDYLTNKLFALEHNGYSDRNWTQNTKIFINNKEIDYKENENKTFYLDTYDSANIIIPNKINGIDISNAYHSYRPIVYKNKIYLFGSACTNSTAYYDVTLELSYNESNNSFYVSNAFHFENVRNIDNWNISVTENLSHPDQPGHGWGYRPYDIGFGVGTRLFLYKNLIYISGLVRLGENAHNPKYDEYIVEYEQRQGYVNKYEKWISHSDLTFSFDGNQFNYIGNGCPFGGTGDGFAPYPYPEGASGSSSSPSGYVGLEYNNKVYLTKTSSTGYEGSGSGYHSSITTYLGNNKWKDLETNLDFPTGQGEYAFFFVLDNKLFLCTKTIIYQRITDSNWVEREDLVFKPPYSTSRKLMLNLQYNYHAQSYLDQYYFGYKNNYFVHQNELYYYGTSTLYKYNKETKKYELFVTGFPKNQYYAQIVSFNNKIIIFHKYFNSSNKEPFRYSIVNPETKEIENNFVKFEIR